VKSGLVQSLDGRVGAYRAEVRRMMMMDADPDGGPVDVGALFVLKDSLGAMFESAGMYQEACNEYSELEAMIEDCVGRCAAVGGNDGEGDEAAGAEGHVAPGGSERNPPYQAECSVSQVAVRVVVTWLVSHPCLPSVMEESRSRPRRTWRSSLAAPNTNCSPNTLRSRNTLRSITRTRAWTSAASSGTVGTGQGGLSPRWPGTAAPTRS